jgi:UV excision repair protein RAD23
MKITIKSLKQLTYDVEISEKSTVSELKKLVEEKHGFDSSNIKLLYTGIILEDKKTLSEYNMKEPNSYIVTMLNVKVKPKNLVKEEEKVEEKPIKEEVNPVNVAETQKVNKEENQEKSSANKQPVIRQNVEKVFEEYNAQIKQLVDMGFSEEMAKNALNAAKGDIPTAIDFLYSGIPSANKVHPVLSEFLDENEEEEGEGQVELNQDAINNIDLNDANALKNISSVVKVIINEDPDQLQNLLEDIEEINPEIIEYIKQNENEFKNLISQPITSQDLLVFDQLMGGKDEEAYDEEEIVGEGIHNILANANNFNNLNTANLTSNVTFTPNERESIERIKALGFSELDVMQAFIACDKNEELTANFLLENKYKDDDMDIDCKNIFYYFR